MSTKANKTKPQTASSTPAPEGRQAIMSKLAHEAFAASYAAKTAADKAKGEKEGAYSLLAKLFNMKPTQAGLKAVLAVVESDYRTGKLEGCPVILGKADKDGNQSPVLPGSYKTAKGTIAAALELGVKVAPDASYGAIKKAVDAAKLAEKAEAMSEADKLRESLVADLLEIVDQLKDGSIPATRFDVIREGIAVMLATEATEAPTTAEILVDLAA